MWLLPVALLGMLALAWQRRPRFQVERQQQSLILWGIWLLTMAVFFSVATFFHQYYLSTFAPAICALFGIGIVVMWQDYRRSGWRGWLLPLALILTAIEQVHIILSDPSWGTWLIPLIAIPCALAAVILFVARLIPRLGLRVRVLVPALCLGLGRSSTVDSALIRYLEAHRGSAKYLVAVISSNEADSIILATNQPVMALGGFSGSDPILTTAQLAALVQNGTVRYFLLNGTGGGGPGGGQSTLTTWITQHTTAVPASQWQSASTSSGFGGTAQLYAYTPAS